MSAEQHHQPWSLQWYQGGFFFFKISKFLWILIIGKICYCSDDIILFHLKSKMISIPRTVGRSLIKFYLFIDCALLHTVYTLQDIRIFCKKKKKIAHSLWYKYSKYNETIMTTYSLLSQNIIYSWLCDYLFNADCIFKACTNMTSPLTHCGLMTPYGDIDLGQHWLR